MFGEAGHADVAQVPLVDHVMGGNGVAEKYIGLPEGDCVDGVLVGGVGDDRRFGVQLFDFVQGQVVIDHAQPQPFEIVGQGPVFTRPGDQDRLIHGIGSRQDDAGGSGFETVGTAEQVDLPLLERGNGRLAGGEAQDFHWQAGRFGDEARIIGGHAFIVAPAGGKVEGRVIRRGSSEDQFLATLQPGSLGLVETDFDRIRRRATQ